MRPWVIWMINNRLGWLVCALVYATLPVQLVVSYWPECFSDAKYTVRNVRLLMRGVK